VISFDANHGDVGAMTQQLDDFSRKQDSLVHYVMNSAAPAVRHINDVVIPNAEAATDVPAQSGATVSASSPSMATTDTTAPAAPPTDLPAATPNARSARASARADHSGARDQNQGAGRIGKAESDSSADRRVASLSSQEETASASSGIDLYRAYQKKVIQYLNTDPARAVDELKNGKLLPKLRRARVRVEIDGTAHGSDAPECRYRWNSPEQNFSWVSGPKSVCAP
jgi:hypothetical protein